MSNVDFDTNSNTLSHHTAHSDIYVPTTTDGTPIRWIGDNDATIDGTLYEVGRFYKRSGLFQSYFRHHAVALSNGKLAIDSINSVYFISGKNTNTRKAEWWHAPAAQRPHAAPRPRATTTTTRRTAHQRARRIALTHLRTHERTRAPRSIANTTCTLMLQMLHLHTT